MLAGGGTSLGLGGWAGEIRGSLRFGRDDRVWGMTERKAAATTTAGLSASVEMTG
jgi:hypothetical protein